MHESAKWHSSDVADLTDYVGSWGKSGLAADIAETTRLTHMDIRTLQISDSKPAPINALS